MAYIFQDPSASQRFSTILINMTTIKFCDAYIRVCRYMTGGRVSFAVTINKLIHGVGLKRYQ